MRIQHNHKIHGVIFFATMVGLHASSIGSPKVPNCRAQLADVDRAKFESAFRQNFCSKRNCEKRWKNFSYVFDHGVNDARIDSVPIAAYIFATVVVETGIIDYAPAKEIPSKTSKNKSYENQGYSGRGWIQLTDISLYKKVSNKPGLNIDFVKYREKLTEPSIAYEVLVRGMIEGWPETYRSNASGAGGDVPILLSDFVNADSTDYGLARAVINNNCIRKDTCNFSDRIDRGQGRFMPVENRLDANPSAANYALTFENALCTSLKAK